MALTEPELLTLLGSDRANDAKQLADWMVTTAPDATREQLARALRTAETNRRANVWFRGAVLAVLAVSVPSLVADAHAAVHGAMPLPETALPWLIPLFLAASVRTDAQTRAGLLLAELQDARAVAPLAQAWRPSDGTGSQQLIRALLPLLQALTESQACGETHPEAAHALRALVRRAFTARYQARSLDLSDGDADLMVAVLRYLSRTGDLRDIALLRALAVENHHPTQVHVSALSHSAPNRALVREAACVYHSAS